MQLRKIVGAAVAVAASLGAAPAYAGLQISEYIEGSSYNKAIEIYNDGDSEISLSAVQLKLYFNGATSAGSTISLSGTLAAGDVYVIAHSSATFVASADYATSALSFNGDDAVELLQDGVVVDSIGQKGVDPGTAWGSSPTITMDATLRKPLDGVADTDDSDAYDPSAYFTGYATDTIDGLGCPGLDACEASEVSFVSIPAIQGATHTSPYAGQYVKTRGIVTAVRTNSGYGFYLQDPDGDSNDATSDAVYVYTASTPTVSVGDEVIVQGLVSEYASSSSYLTLTEITSPTVTTPEDVGAYFTNSTVASTHIGIGGRAIPTTVIDDDTTGSINNDANTTFDPENDGIDFWESLEGMLVDVSNVRVVGPSDEYGEVYIVTDNGDAATGNNTRGGITIRDLGDGEVDFNPERVQLDDILNAGLPTLNVGDTSAAITGVMHYSYGAYELLPLETPTFTSADLDREFTSLPYDSDRLTVANYNVENLDPNDDDENSAGSGCPDADVANGHFSDIADQIVNHLGGPDIVALQEIQDNSGCVDDGVVASDVTLATLVQAIADAGGPSYQAFDITPANDSTGGMPGGNIRNAYLYNPDRVALVPGTLGAGGSTDAATPTLDDDDQLALNFSPGLVAPNSSAFSGTRRPLAAVWEFNGHRVVTVNNHFSSKGGSGYLYGPNQPPENGSESEREAEATELNAFVDSVLAVDADAAIVTLGDFNEFSFYEPMKIARGEPEVLTDLADALLPAEERYSYNFEGNSQELDHMMVSSSLVNAEPEIDVVHVNSEFAEQVSDHDPVMASFSLPAGDCDAGVLNFTSDKYSGKEGGDSVVISVERSGGSCGVARTTVKATGGEAIEGSDFTIDDPELKWADGESGVKSITVNIIDDSLSEGPEIAKFKLKKLRHAAAGEIDKVGLKIHDNDN